MSTLSASSTTSLALRGRLLDPEDWRWRDFLGGVPHDVYHLPEYVRFSARHEGGRAAAFVSERGGARLFVPLIIKPIPSDLGAPEGLVDATSPYGYASPITTPGTPPQVFEELMADFLQTCRDRQIVSGFFRLHPMLDTPTTALQRCGTVVTHGETVYVDLRKPIGAITREFRSNHAVGIRKLLRDGFTAAIDQWNLLSSFQEAYQQTMQRVSADAYYLFSNCYFEDLCAALDHRIHLCSVLAPTGEVASAGLFSEHGGLVQYLFGGTDERFLRNAPSKLMFDAMIRWAHQREDDLFHLGGGLGARADSLFLFKRGFSPLTLNYRTFRAVFDQPWYSTLVERRRLADEASAAARSHAGFFPHYRRPTGIPAFSFGQSAPDS